MGVRKRRGVLEGEIVSFIENLNIDFKYAGNNRYFTGTIKKRLQSVYMKIAIFGFNLSAISH